MPAPTLNTPHASVLTRNEPETNPKLTFYSPYTITIPTPRSSHTPSRTRTTHPTPSHPSTLHPAAPTIQMTPATDMPAPTPTLSSGVHARSTLPLPALTHTCLSASASRMPPIVSCSAFARITEPCVGTRSPLNFRQNEGNLTDWPVPTYVPGGGARVVQLVLVQRSIDLAALDMEHLLAPVE